MTDTLLSAIRRIEVDDLIMVAFPIGEKTNNPAHKLDGQQFVVKTKRKTKTNKGGDTYQYTLYGAEAKAGKPYSFLTDELVKL